MGLVDRVSMIATTVEAVCGPTDDAHVAGMRVATFCLALNFHMAQEVDQVKRATNFVSQVRDISGCTGQELTAAIALFSIRAQDLLQEEIQRVEAEREAATKETNGLPAITQALETLLVGLTARSESYRNHNEHVASDEVASVIDRIQAILANPTAVLDG